MALKSLCPSCSHAVPDQRLQLLSHLCSSSPGVPCQTDLTLLYVYQDPVKILILKETRYYCLFLVVILGMFPTEVMTYVWFWLLDACTVIIGLLVAIDPYY